MLQGEEYINLKMTSRRSLGDFYLSPFVGDEPFVRTVDITDEHSFIIFACDGCFDVLTDDQAVDIVKKSLSINPGENQKVF